MTMTMDIEYTKDDIINWVRKIKDEHLINTLEELRLKERIHHIELTEEQKREIIRAISSLEED